MKIYIMIFLPTVLMKINYLGLDMTSFYFQIIYINTILVILDVLYVFLFFKEVKIYLKVIPFNHFLNNP